MFAFLLGGSLCTGEKRFLALKQQVLTVLLVACVQEGAGKGIVKKVRRKWFSTRSARGHIDRVEDDTFVTGHTGFVVAVGTFEYGFFLVGADPTHSCGTHVSIFLPHEVF